MNHKYRRFAAGLFAGLFLLLPVSASGRDEDFAPQMESVVPALEPVSGDPPSISAKSAVLTDSSGNVLYAYNADEVMPMASTTKIMTGLVALEMTEDLDAGLTIPAGAVGVEGSSIYLYKDEKLTMRELLYAMLMESANDAAAAIAILSAGSIEAFAEKMNQTAAEMQLTQTHFVNPHGLDDPKHHTTAKELAAITSKALENKDFRDIVSTYKKEIPLHGGEGIRLLVNHNRLLKSYEGCIGVKTGFTKKSGRCLVSAAERNGCTLICVTLQAPDDWNDHAALFDWGFSQYEAVTLSQVGEQYAVLPVVGGITDAADGIATVAVKNTMTLQTTLLKENQHIKKVVELPQFLYAPVEKGSLIGRVMYYNNDVLIGELPLYTCEEAALYVKPTLWQRICAALGFGKKENTPEKTETQEK